MRWLIFFCLLVAGCSPYENNEFTSCEDYKTKIFSHSLSGMYIPLPRDWDTEVNLAQGDTLSATAIDSATLRENDKVRTIGFIQFPTTMGYRDNWRYIRRGLQQGESFLRVERGLIRLEGEAFEYLIGNEALNSVMVIPFQIENQMVTLIARIDRRDNPVLNDFCFMGPVLEEFVRLHYKTRS